MIVSDNQIFNPQQAAEHAASHTNVSQANGQEQPAGENNNDRKQSSGKYCFEISRYLWKYYVFYHEL